ncbi:MAG TPA: 1-deoxy-D-xylulose-5-phosphate reductoisomerase [Mycobacteriales bacterium]
MTLLGSTGSIGTQALDVIGRNPERFRVHGLAANGSDPKALAAQALSTRAAVVAIGRAANAEDVLLAVYAEAQKRGYAGGDFAVPRLLTGPDSAAQLAAEPVDVVLNGIDGSAGLPATLAALRAGSTLALANKESLIAGADLVFAARRRPEQIVPVDSEHSAMAQCLRGGRADEVRRIVLTASGGPFRGYTKEQTESVTPEQALRHPVWAMGRLNTLNSATLVNKGLELLEAHLLFGVPLESIEVVVNPGSVVHSLVEFRDGSTLAQLSPPDMRLPISLALGWPDRVADAAPTLDWSAPFDLHFEPVDHEVFPAVTVARRAGARGGLAPCAFNAANEQAVAAFADGRIGFRRIVEIVSSVVEEAEGTATDLDAVLACEAWARVRARELAETDGTGR